MSNKKYELKEMESLLNKQNIKHKYFALKNKKKSIKQ